MWTSPESCEFWLSPISIIEQIFDSVNRSKNELWPFILFCGTDPDAARLSERRPRSGTMGRPSFAGRVHHEKKAGVDRAGRKYRKTDDNYTRTVGTLR